MSRSSSSSSSSLSINMLMMGDEGVGKRHCHVAFLTGSCPPMNQTPFVPCDSVMSSHQTVDGRDVSLSLWQDYYEKSPHALRPLRISSADCVLLCFGIDSLPSLHTIRDRWAEEVTAAAKSPQVVRILVGLKADLRNPKDKDTDTDTAATVELVSKEEAESVATQIGAATYVECSAKTGEGLKEMFEEAMRQTMQVLAPERRKKCEIM